MFQLNLSSDCEIELKIETKTLIWAEVCEINFKESGKFKFDNSFKVERIRMKQTLYRQSTTAMSTSTSGVLISKNLEQKYHITLIQYTFDIDCREKK